MPLLSQERSIDEGLQASTIKVEEEGATAEVDIVMSGVNANVLIAPYVEDNTSQNKG